MDYRAGPSPQIALTFKTAGKRSVTVITGLESFRIPHDVLSVELRVAAAASVTVLPLPPVKGSKVVKHSVSVQGNLAPLITKLLIEKGVPNSAIVVLKKNK